MRVRFIFDLVNKGAELPYHHQYLVTEFLTPYIQPYVTSARNPSEIGYNFSALKGQTSIGKEGLHFFSSRVSLVFSSNDPALVASVAHQLFNQKEVMLGNLKLQPIQIDQEIPTVFATEMKYICLSPIALFNPEEHAIDAKRFIHPSFDIFSDALYENTLNRMEHTGVTAEELNNYFQFQLIADKEYLNRTKDNEKKFARNYPVFIHGNKNEVRGYTFPFTLYAHPNVQEFIFHCGLGVFSEKGFGMLDIANTDLHARVIPYTWKA